MSYIPRAIEPVVLRAAQQFPTVVLTGPRQSGKTTLLRQLFGKSHSYRSLEPPDVRAAAATDPRGFLALNPPPVIFDEVQYAPELLPYIKERIDAQRDLAGQYLLTGSQNLLMMERVTESLAGRAAILRLMPLTRREAHRQTAIPLPWEEAARPMPQPEAALVNLWPALLRGGYPELAANPERDSELWHSSYIQTYLERDVRLLRQVGDLSLFQSFLRALAARNAQLLSLTDIGRDLGVALNTVKAWLSILEASFQVIVLRPYYTNLGRRLVKTPKIYFTDTGTLCHLVGLRDPGHAAASPMAGGIFEAAVLGELVKTFLNRGTPPQLYFWRTGTGTEVDFVVEEAGRLIPIEVKLSATPRPAMTSGIAALRAALGDQVGPGYLVHPGDAQLPLGQGVATLPFATL